MIRIYKQPGKERGVAMLELAIAAPVLFLLCCGLIDISRMILTHIAFTQVVREAVRQASGNQGLEVGSYRLTAPSGRVTPASLMCRDGNNASCRACYFPNTPPGLNRDHEQHCLLRAMYFALAQRGNEVSIKWDTLRLDSTRFDTANPSPDGDDDAVEFVITAEYDGFFPPFRSGRFISAKAVASIL